MVNRTGSRRRRRGAPRTMVLCVVSILLLAATAHADKPTRDEIIAFSDACTKRRVKMDLVGRFGTDFSGLNLRGVNFRGASSALGTDLRGADFTDADLTGADFYDAILDGANLTGADLADANLNWVSLRKATLQDVNLTGASLSRVDFSGANMAGVDLSQSDPGDFWPANFQNADLTDADLHGLTLPRARFQGARLRRANLRECELEQADFTGADLQGADFANARVVGAVFRDVRGLSDAETQQLNRAAGRWRFLLRTYVVAFLDSFAFPVCLLVAVPLVATWVGHLGKRAPARNHARLQFRLASILLFTAGVCGFLGIALLSWTGAYSLAMVGAFYMMVGGLLNRTEPNQAEKLGGSGNRKFALGLLIAAMVYLPLNLAVYFAVAALGDPFLLFTKTFAVAVVFVGPGLAIVSAIAAAILAGRAKMRLPTLSLVGFCIWTAGVGCGNIWLIGEIAGGV